MDNETRARLIAEHDELVDRVLKLTTFVRTGKFAGLVVAERVDLIEQLGLMRSYLTVLGRRIVRSG